MKTASCFSISSARPALPLLCPSAPGPKFTATRPASLACKAARGIDSDTRERDAVSSSISNGHERLEGRTTNGLARNLGLALPPILTCMVALPALALEIHAEPSNALSLSTWAIHVSSVLEWVVAMGLVWQYAEVTGYERWKSLTWGMLPCLGSAMAACTWHFFYNSPDLEFLVILQAFLTIVGNCTCWYAAWRIYTESREPEAS